MKPKIRKLAIILLIGLIIMQIIRYLLLIGNGIFFFAFDQARDALWVKNQADFFKISLIGPWSSLEGVFFGPLWFWLSLIPYFLTHGHPAGFTFFNGLIVFLPLFLASYLLKKQAKSLSYFILLVGFLSYNFFNIATFAFSQHLLPLFTFLLVYALTNLLKKPTYSSFYLATLALSLMHHAEPILILFSLPSLLSVIIYQQIKHKFLNLGNIATGLFLFFLPFIPQVIFEIRHNFSEISAIINFLYGYNTSLGGVLPFGPRIIDRVQKIYLAFPATVLLKPQIISFGFFVLAIYLNIKLNSNLFMKKFWQASLIYIAGLFITGLVYAPEFKPFYLEGIQIIMIILFANAMFILYRQKSLLNMFIIGSFVFLAIVFNIDPFGFLHTLKTDFGQPLTVTGLYRNQQNAVDWIYQSSKNQGFKVYTYQGAVYDYPYQYIFTTYALKKYDYLPEEFSYLPDKPEYVPNKSLLLDKLRDKIRPGQNNIYLIIEPDIFQSRIDEWRTNFPFEKYPLVDQLILPDKTMVEKRLITN